MNSAWITFFDSLRTEADLDNLAQTQREESLYLEFKEKHERATPDLHENDRKNFSKAVSGFANADGGILIFGMATAKGADNIDRANGLRAIRQHQRFRASLLSSVLNTTQPVVDSVRIEAIPAHGDEGYVKCLIPPSIKPPHRAMLAGREYWVRTSDRHRRMEHFELEDVFGRRLRPSLRLALELRVRPDPDPYEELHFAFLNEGRGVAKHAGLVCSMPGVTIAAVHRLDQQSELNGGVPTVTYYDAHSVVHANGIFSALGAVTITRPNRGAPLRISVVWYAENMQARRQTVTVTPGPRALIPLEVPT
jgi:hypothetical protein